MLEEGLLFGEIQKSLNKIFKISFKQINIFLPPLLTFSMIRKKSLTAGRVEEIQVYFLFLM